MSNIEIKDNRKKNKIENKVIEVAKPNITYSDPVPRFDYVLISRNEAETTWNGTNFIIPDSAQKKPNVGIVVAISEFYICDGLTFPTANVCKPGDIVTFGQFNAETLIRNGEEFDLVSVFDLKLIESAYYTLGVSNA